jgi:hypothetical protein
MMIQYQLDRDPAWRQRIQDTVNTIRFPAVASEEKYSIAGQEYTCYLKGNTLVDINPREGEHYTVPVAFQAVLPIREKPRIPIYLRDHDRQEEVPMKWVARYVSPITPEW